MTHVAIFVEQLCLGGAERVASLWAKGFIQNGYKVTIITDLSKEIVYDVDKNVQLFDLYKYGNVFNKKHLIKSLMKIRKITKEIDPDVIITVLYPLDLLILPATINLGIPIINTEHNSFERPSGCELSFLAKFVRFFLNRFFSHVTVLTEADKIYIGSRLKNVSVLPNPLTFVPLANVSSKENVIIASGRLDAWHCKGFDILIKAWGRIAFDYPEWKLRICGTGSDESLNFLCSLARQSLVENRVDFLGFRSDIQALFAQSSIFVLSSRYEGFGMVLIEAMSQGCACVACDYKGRQREIIENESQGILCEPDNIESLATALKKLLDNKSYRIECQKNAVERSKFYKLDNIMNFWDDIFYKLKVEK